jgi:hypothetical protein
MANGSDYPAEFIDSNGNVRDAVTLRFTDSTAQPQPGSNPVTSGALSTTTAWVSGTAKQISTTAQVTLCFTVTGDATNNATTCTIQLSPDASTYSTVLTAVESAAVNNTGALDTPVTLVVPKGWSVKITFTHCTVSAGTYY